MNKTINVPKEIKSIVKHCPVGGLDGYYVTRQQLSQFAKILNKKYIDEIIPLNNPEQINPDTCNCIKKQDPNELDYWETPEGSHGWCCRRCGRVLQWG